MILIDFDGVILDTEQKYRFLRKKKQENNNINFDWYSLIKHSNQINHSVDILKELQEMKKEIAILTKVGSNNEINAKIWYLREIEKIYFPVFLCPNLRSKTDIYVPVNNEILVDDAIHNVEDWTKCGGQGILFDPTDSRDYPNKVKSLEFLKK